MFPAKRYHSNIHATSAVGTQALLEAVVRYDRLRVKTNDLNHPAEG
jgi:hypothetical protein